MGFKNVDPRGTLSDGARGLSEVEGLALDAISFGVDTPSLCEN